MLSYRPHAPAHPDGTRPGVHRSSGISRDHSVELSYKDAVLTDRPAVYWRLGETPGSTVAADATGNGHHGSYSRVTLGVAGALRADGDTAARFVQYSGVLGAPAFEPVAVEPWVRTTVTGDRPRP